MLTRSLYPLFLGCVLLIAGCGTESSRSPDRSEAATATRDTTPPQPSSAEPDSASIRVLVLGNSIAAGAGVDSEEAFPARLQEKVDSLGWPVNIVNAGVSGETTAGGLRRIGWLLRNPVDVLLLELGGNDGLRGTDVSATRQNLQAIIDTTNARYPDVRILLAGMQIPPNLGQDYTQEFRSVYPELARQNDNVTLIPFILEGVGGVDSLMQSDGIHPNVAGHRRVAQNAWDYLRPMLDSLRQATAAQGSRSATGTR